MPFTGLSADRHLTSWYRAWSARRSASVSASAPPALTRLATSRVVRSRGPRSDSVIAGIRNQESGIRNQRGCEVLVQASKSENIRFLFARSSSGAMMTAARGGPEEQRRALLIALDLVLFTYLLWFRATGLSETFW